MNSASRSHLAAVPPLTVPSVRGDDARARLVQAAIECFAELGFHGTTTRLIAAQAGMSSAAMYVHYKSKEQLLYLISKAGHEAMLTQLRADAATATGPVEQVEAMVRGFVLSQARNPRRARVVNYETGALNPQHATEWRPYDTSLRR